VENTVVFHNTGTLNTAKVSHNFKPGKILVTRRDSKLNIGSSELLKLQKMVMIQSYLVKLQVLKLLIMKLILLITLLLYIQLKMELSQMTISEANGTVKCSSIDQETILSNFAQTMDQDLRSMNSLLSITGVFTV